MHGANESCLRCGKPRASALYCAECQSDIDDEIFGNDITLRRTCASCGKSCLFSRINNCVIECTFCHVPHEIKTTLSESV